MNFNNSEILSRIGRETRDFWPQTIDSSTTVEISIWLYRSGRRVEIYHSRNFSMSLSFLFFAISIEIYIQNQLIPKIHYRPQCFHIQENFFVSRKCAVRKQCTREFWSLKDYKEIEVYLRIYQGNLASARINWGNSIDFYTGYISPFTPTFVLLDNDVELK